MSEGNSFLGTYFRKETVLILAKVARVFAWIIAVFYAAQWLLQLAALVFQVGQGYWMGMRTTDIAQNILWQLEQPLRGLVYFIVLQGVAQALLLFMDMEDNTRRAAREHEKTQFPGQEKRA